MLKGKINCIFLLTIITISLLLISGCSNIFSNTYGSIEVTTYPSGAKIFLGGNDIEHVTPYTINNLAKGTYVVTVTLGNISYTEEVQVYSNIASSLYKDLVPRLSKILVKPSSMNLEIGEFKFIDSIIAYYIDSDSIVLNPSDCNYSSNSNHAIVDSVGTITGVSKGSATINVSYIDVEITKTDSINVFVETEPLIEPPIIVTEDGAPIANIRVTPGSTGIVPFTVSFDASGSSTNGQSGSSITSYSWDFGDSDTDTGIIVTHTYNNIGLYPVILTITDSNGKKDYATVTITVNEPGAPTAVISTVPDPPTGFAPLVMHFDAYNSSADADITSYDWVFGDGGTGTGASINHTFNTVGTYVTSLTVTDLDGKEGFATVTITVNEEPVLEIGSITVNANPQNNIAGGTSTITAVVIDTEGQFVANGTTVYFLTNNGALSAGSATTTNGMATVTLTLSDMLVGDTATVTAFIGAVNGSIGVTCTSETGTSIGNITVSANPESNVPDSTSTVTAVVTDTEGQFVADGTTVYFLTNNGALSVASATTTNGMATVTLTLSNMLVGDTATVTAFIGAVNGSIGVTCTSETGTSIGNITVYANPTTNVPGGTSTITAVVTDNEGQFVADGTTVYFLTNNGVLSGGSATTTNGMATVNLTLDASMQVDETATITAFIGAVTDSVEVTCAQEVGPIAVITKVPNPAEGIAPFEVYFDAYASTAEAGIASYEWDFGDGDSALGIITNHTYGDVGTYTVILTITDNNGNKGYSNTGVIVTKAPTAVINTTPAANDYYPNGDDKLIEGNIPFKVYFDAYGSESESGIVSYGWEFGDGDTGEGITVNHTYTAPGIYIVYLTITDSNGYEAYDVAFVAVGAAGDVNAVIKSTPADEQPSGTDPFTVGFDASDSTTSASGATIISYTWDFDDGVSIVTNGIVTPGVPPIPVITYTFTPEGTHLVQLTVEDSLGNKGYAFKSIEVTIPE